MKKAEKETSILTQRWLLINAQQNNKSYPKISAANAPYADLIPCIYVSASTWIDMNAH